MIRTHSTKLNISVELLASATTIKGQNNHTNTPAKYQKRTLVGELNDQITNFISTITSIPAHKLDAVYFSSPNGAAPHKDLLSPDVFESTTYIIPIILPKWAQLVVGSDQVAMELGGVYQFDHETVHSLEVSDDSGCVLIMVAIRKD